MSVTNTNSTTTYSGNGVTTLFLIDYQFFGNDQVKVKRKDLTTGVITVLTEGADYTIYGGDPGTHVAFGTAPTANEEITVYRETPIKQIVDYINAGTFLQEDHEKGMDRLCMMIQEISRDLGGVAPVQGNAYTELSSQAVAASGTITINSNLRLIKRIKGDTADSNVIADTTTPISNGLQNWQELVLIGNSDTDTLELQSGGNLKLNADFGNVIFVKEFVLSLVWDTTNSYWLEVSRSR